MRDRWLSSLLQEERTALAASVAGLKRSGRLPELSQSLRRCATLPPWLFPNSKECRVLLMEIQTLGVGDALLELKVGEISSRASKLVDDDLVELLGLDGGK